MKTIKSSTGDTFTTISIKSPIKKCEFDNLVFGISAITRFWRNSPDKRKQCWNIIYKNINLVSARKLHIEQLQVVQDGNEGTVELLE